MRALLGWEKAGTQEHSFSLKIDFSYIANNFIRTDGYNLSYHENR
jgi:hypothetical protein